MRARTFIPVGQRSSHLGIVELEQAMAVCEFRTDAGGESIWWSVEVTNAAVGKIREYGYLLH